MMGELEDPHWTIADFVLEAERSYFASERLYPSWQRLHGYIDVHLEAGVTVDPHLIRRAGSYSAEAVGRPTAIFTADDLMTAGTMVALGAARISIPTELSVICFDDLDWMAFMQPGIDAVAQPRGAMGETAAQPFLDRIGGDTAPARNVVLAKQLICRGSTAPPGKRLHNQPA